MTLAFETNENNLLPLKWSLMQLQDNVTLETAVKAKHIRDVCVTLGKELVLKLMVLVIKCFVDSVKVKQKIGALEMVELAQHLLGTYFGESLEDFILCFKQAKFSGQKFYQSLGQTEIIEFVNAYFNQKAEYLEEQHRKEKDRGLTNDHVFLNNLQEESKTNEKAKEYIELLAKIENSESRRRFKHSMAFVSRKSILDKDDLELLEWAKRYRRQEAEKEMNFKP